METLNLGIGLLLGLVLVLAAYWFVQGWRPQSLSDVARMVLEAERVARVLVDGAEQVFRSNQTHGVDTRYQDVEDALLELFPNLSPRHAKQIIEAAVFARNEAERRGWLPGVESGEPVAVEAEEHG